MTQNKFPLNSFLKKSKYGLIIACFTLFGCSSSGGGDNDNNSGFTASVINLLLDDGTIRVNESSILRAFFSFSSDRVFDDKENVVLVVRVPTGVAYQIDSAEIQRPIDDRSIGAQIINCPTGEQFLVFDMDSDDLDTAENPSGNADAELSLTINGVAATAATDIQAAARENTVNFQCGSPFAADLAVSIVVVP